MYAGGQKLFMLVVVGFPAKDASVPQYALIKKILSDIAIFEE